VSHAMQNELTVVKRTVKQKLQTQVYANTLKKFKKGENDLNPFWCQA
jgi:hypothetical protein